VPQADYALLRHHAYDGGLRFFYPAAMNAPERPSPHDTSDRLTHIVVRGARTHNLQGVNVDIPKGQLVVITGPSGSGKSSLAFDTLYAEGQRRYVESLSTYARQFLHRLDKPDVDWIEGLSPAIAIEQKASNHNPRSTVGTVTEILDHLRLLMARAGTSYCPTHDTPLQAFGVSDMVDQVLALPEGSPVALLAPQIAQAEVPWATQLARAQAMGFTRWVVDGQLLEDAHVETLSQAQDVALVVDRLKVRAGARQRVAESVETALKLGDGVLGIWPMGGSPPRRLNARWSCPHCQHTAPNPEPRMFSFNSPHGACPLCDGLGHVVRFDPARVVAFPSLSLASGAIRGWDRRNPQAMAWLQALADALEFDLEAPFESLPAQVQHAVLWGTGEQTLKVSLPRAKGAPTAQQVPFEGVMPSLERRWSQTQSNLVRDELARLRAPAPCPSCLGTRLRDEARHVFIGEGAQRRNLPQWCQITLADLQRECQALDLRGARADIAARVLQEITARLRFLNNVGLGYLNLNRSAESLSGGEAQRIRLASQIGSGLSGVMYVLDEPSIGLHQRDNDRLIATLRHLRDLGNTVLVVEHDEDMIRAADHVLDLGPGAGAMGGHVVAQGSPQALQDMPESLTGQYLSRAQTIAVPTQRVAPDPARQIEVRGARGHTLQGLHVAFPVGLMTCVTGVSGSGKSTLVNDTLLRAMSRLVHRASAEAADHDDLLGHQHVDHVVSVDQSPIGRTPRSNPATYTGVFGLIRDLMAETPTARERGYGPGRFSFNVAGGRCEACQGDGVTRVEMHFLPDVYVTCEVCQGVRYNRETLEVRYKGLHIADILNLTVTQALAFFEAMPAMRRKLQTLLDVGLGYLRLGQNATTLSGGEAQRIKLALELSKRQSGRTLYVLDEPTTGLHFADIALLLEVLQRLRDAGNTLVVIEHNLDVIKTADWVIDLGPEGGDAGGQLVCQGTPETVAACPTSHTGRYLSRMLAT
jgi:excinuclease ABC subunit A